MKELFRIIKEGVYTLTIQSVKTGETYEILKKSIVQ